MKSTDNRVDASLLTAEERGVLQGLLDLAQRDPRPCLKGADGTEIPLPQPIFEVLVRVIRDMRHGKAVVLMPEDETFTTQAAANFLGMSRQYFVTLVESGQIPFHRVGSHRRVYFKDLRDFAKKRDAERRGGLKRLFTEVDRAGLYDASYAGEG
jgi:excisionase family DNA binding protein